ncbi:MAG: poly(R)-hydroxyalkanoic acid synthase subunit PhaE [Desulfomonilaceae bacterium]|nr:poly(R)-hydroxyalkanoic acid synthase subunit PhaE [Desulfomonilaceae bacterium]
MTGDGNEANNPLMFLQAWLKMSSEMWGASLKVVSDAGEASVGEDHAKKGSGGKMMDSWMSGLKALHALSAAMSEPGAVEGLLKGANTLPEIVVKMVQPAMEGFLHLQKEWMEKAGRIGKSTAAYNFDNLDQEAFRAWSEIYEKEFRRFLNIPQLGLTRFYQERIGEAADKFNVFQAAMAEFVSLLYLPVEKSSKVVQDQLAEMAEKGKLPEKSKDYYRIWIKTLEGHYMTLFKSPEYAEDLRRTLDALSDYAAARQKTLEDALRLLPIPTQKDMDEFYKEIYILKKRIREIEKKIRNAGTQRE